MVVGQRTEWRAERTLSNPKILKLISESSLSSGFNFLYSLLNHNKNTIVEPFCNTGFRSRDNICALLYSRRVLCSPFKVCLLPLAHLLLGIHRKVELMLAPFPNWKAQ